jgi:large subunit ribosomal protein L15
MKLNEVHTGIKKFKKRRRIGRGPGSGHGKTAGRGHKGQGSRAGWSRQVTFQGGTMPMVRRIPKRGFTNSFAPKVAVINVQDLDRYFAAGDEVTPESIGKTPMLGHRYDELKILGNGELSKKLKVSAHRFSKSAVEKIEQAGGEVVRIPGTTPVEAKKKAAKEASAKK